MVQGIVWWGPSCVIVPTTWKPHLGLLLSVSHHLKGLKLLLHYFPSHVLPIFTFSYLMCLPPLFLISTISLFTISHLSFSSVHLPTPSCHLIILLSNGNSIPQFKAVLRVPFFVILFHWVLLGYFAISYSLWSIRKTTNQHSLNFVCFFLCPFVTSVKLQGMCKNGICLKLVLALQTFPGQGTTPPIKLHLHSSQGNGI